MCPKIIENAPGQVLTQLRDWHGVTLVKSNWRFSPYSDPLLKSNCSGAIWSDQHFLGAVIHRYDSQVCSDHSRIWNIFSFLGDSDWVARSIFLKFTELFFFYYSSSVQLWIQQCQFYSTLVLLHLGWNFNFTTHPFWFSLNNSETVKAVTLAFGSI